MLCIVFAGIVETISGVARTDIISITPVRVTPALVMGMGAALAAAATPIEVLVAWVSLCTFKASVDDKLSDSRSFLSSLTIPAAATIVGCFIFFLGANWQARVDKLPPVADISPGIRLSVDDESGEEDGDDDENENENENAKDKNNQETTPEVGGKKGGASDPSTPLPLPQVPKVIVNK